MHSLLDEIMTVHHCIIDCLARCVEAVVLDCSKVSRWLLLIQGKRVGVLTTRALLVLPFILWLACWHYVLWSTKAELRLVADLKQLLVVKVVISVVDMMWVLALMSHHIWLILLGRLLARWDCVAGLIYGHNVGEQVFWTRVTLWLFGS